jgi:hypothetical protein
MSPDARQESPPPKFRAVLPPELEGVDVDDDTARSVPHDPDELDALLEAEWAKADGD